MAGRSVVTDRRVVGIDLPAIRHEVLTQVRAGLAANGTLAEALAALDRIIPRHYLADPPVADGTR